MHVKLSCLPVVVTCVAKCTVQRNRLGIVTVIGLKQGSESVVTKTLAWKLKNSKFVLDYRLSATQPCADVHHNLTFDVSE